ncbi:TPA: hypothetical protein ACPHUW_002827 [Vibrio alginolyticus]|uniref:hypothetical protein n=1 Tax=Vibrio alginolyticus TaxID=663 RepID=UPI00046F2CB8|nr:hypothetical protein [Vibrio alginolyticus]WEK81763.1 hypothetical protein PY250_24095 [Vibrio alginolyticus]
MDIKFDTTEIYHENRHQNLMRIVNQDYNRKIQNLCRHLDMPHLASYLSHRSKPQKNISHRLARNIETKLGMPIGQLDEAISTINVDPTIDDNLPIDKLARSRNLEILLTLIGNGNISKLNSELGCHLNNHLGPNKSRMLGKKLATRIETKLGLRPGTMSVKCTFNDFLPYLNRDQLTRHIESKQEEYDERMSKRRIIIEQRNDIVSQMLKKIASFLEGSGTHEILEDSDIRKVYIPVPNHKNELPILVSCETKPSNRFLILCSKGMTERHDKLTNMILSDRDKFETDVGEMDHYPKIAVINAYDPELAMPSLNNPEITLIIKKALYQLSNLTDDYLLAKFKLKTVYNELVTAQLQYVKSFSSVQIIKTKELLHRGFSIPNIKLRGTRELSHTLLVPVSNSKDTLREVREFAKGSGTDFVLPICINNGNVVSDQFVPTKTWLASHI